MKIYLTLSFYFLFSFFNSLLLAQNKPEMDMTIKIADFEKKASRSKSSKSIKSIGNNYDIKYHRFNWYIDPDSLYIKGSVTTYFTATKEAISNISFELSSVLTVDSVKSNDNKLSFSQTTDNELSIDLGIILTLNSLDSITIYYQGVPPQDPANFGSFVTDFHGMDNKIPILWTLSEPYGSKDWWPCKQSLNDKIDSIDIFVTTPKQYRVASNGILVSELPSGNDKIFHWKHRYPIAAYLIGIAVTNYAVYSDWVPMPGNKLLEVLNYVYPEDSTFIRQQTALTIPFIQLFNKLFSVYPFAKEKYGHAQFNWQGGMEHQTMTFLGHFQYEIIAHELAHQWFGDAVTTGNWHDLWLNEGFATYITGLSYEYIDPGNIWWPDWKAQNIKFITKIPDGSVYVADTADQARLFSSRLTYCKGAMFLHTIRWVIGDSAFFHSLRNYFSDKKVNYAYAQNSDFKSHLEAESGMNLTWLFNDWYYGEGYPTYDIKVVYNQNNNLLVTLNQTTSANISFFKLPVPIRFEGFNKDTTIVFENSFSGQTYNFHLDFPVTSLTFDPENWLIAHSNYTLTNVADNSNIEAQVVISPNPAFDNCYINSVGLNISSIQILDLSGKTILTSTVNKNSSDCKIGINLQNLNKGMYFIKLFTDKGPITKKLLHL